MGKNRVRKNLGILHDKLIVMPGPATFPAYYQLVGKVLREAAREFPMESAHDYGDRLYHEWYEKYFSQLVKKDDK